MEKPTRETSEIQRAQHGIQIGRKRVVVVADRGLAGSTEAPAVVCDDAMTRGKQGRGLLFPGRAAQRPAVDEDHWRSGTVVLVIDFNWR